MLTLESLGWHERHRVWFAERDEQTPARVGAVHGPTLAVLGLHPDDMMRPEMVSSIVGSRGTLAAPTVGDWVACRRSADGWLLADLMPRSACFVRKMSGRSSRAQPIAANVDRVFVVTAVGGDLSARRLERYLTQVWASGAEPVIVVNKIDRAHDPEATLREVASVAAEVPVVRVSALTDAGMADLSPWLEPGSTVALVGSSGVGKSSLVNRLLGEERLATQPVRVHDETGTHTTTHRELVRAPQGFLLIDTPGMRELGLFDAESGLEAAFPELAELAEQCRFGDCQHAREPGCAVRAAVERGLTPAARLHSYLQLRNELAHNQQRAREHAGADNKRRWKEVHRAQRERRKLHAKVGLKDE